MLQKAAKFARQDVVRDAETVLREPAAAESTFSFRFPNLNASVVVLLGSRSTASAIDVFLQQLHQLGHFFVML